ncbi:MAG: DNA repair protein RadA [Christensenellales bacterium]|jgi:DNA repair protein RadA/Sms
MAKTRTKFVCTQCGHETPRWMGQCPGCRQWNTMAEETEITGTAKNVRAVTGAPAKAEKLSEVNGEVSMRDSSGIFELDRVLGGGIVPGSMVLLGGDPGIGKSTLMLQVAYWVARGGKRVLYISGEESARQIKMRAHRLELDADDVYLLTQTDISAVFSQIESTGADVVVVDSIQTMICPEIASAPGSVSQVREAASRLLQGAKSGGYTVFVVGHVTKEGALAGPRVLEHMVDTVLYFEGDRHHQYRILRAVKNRFGSTNEIGLFEMTQQGMAEVENPSGVLLTEREFQAAGSAVICAIEGTRPMLVEVQALVSATAYGTPRRMASGFDYNRMALLLAVLEKRGRLTLSNQDAYVNVAGGLRLEEPAADLAVCMALASSLYNLPVPESTVIMGEVGLTGEVRAVGQLERRILECRNLGFTRFVVPKRGMERAGVREGLIPVSDVAGAIDAVFKRKN